MGRASFESLLPAHPQLPAFPTHPCSQYANVLFINVLRLDTTKKKLQYLKFADYDYITSVIARLWSPGVESGISTAVDLSWGTLDPLIPQDCRELKHVCNSFKSDVLDDLRARVAAAMTAAFIASGAETTTMATTSSCSVPPSKPTAGHTPPITASSSVAAGIANTDPATPNGQPQIVYPAALILERSGTTMLDPKSGPNFFRAMIRSAIAIGIGLGSAKELRDFFMNMLEKIVEPCIAVGWSSTDADFFFVALRDVILQSQLIPQGVRGKFARTWPRLIEGIRLIAERMRLNPAPVGASSVSLAMRSAVSSPAGTSAANVSSNNASERPKRSLFGSTASFTKSFLDRVTRGGD